MSAPWAIVPLHRSGDLPTVIANTHRQRSRVRLVIIENGDAVGACAQARFTPDLLLTSEKHQATARNVALDEIRKRGGGVFLTMDADDWYGPRYVEEIVANAHHADIIGKRRHLVRFPDGLYLFDVRGANKPTTWLHGACLAGRTEDAIPFPLRDVGEDTAWCEGMRSFGAKMFATSAREYIYNRAGTDHTWKANPVMVRHMLGPCFRLGGYPVAVPKPTRAEVFAAFESLVNHLD